MGLGAGSRIASSRNYSRTTQKIMAGVLGLAGAAVGAAVPFYAYLANRETLNVTAISMLASALGNLTRETGQRMLANVGPSVTVAPSAITTALRTGVYGGLLFSSGIARAELSAGAGVAIGAVVEGLDGMSITMINSIRGGAYQSPENNQLSRPKFAEMLYGVTTRTAGSTLTASLALSLASNTGAIDNIHLQTAVVTSLATPTEARTYLGQHVELGAFELLQMAGDEDFVLDRFTPPNREWRNTTPASYHPEMPNIVDLPMRSMERRSSV